MKSLKSYNNLRGDQSKAQQTTILGGLIEKKTPVSDRFKTDRGPVVSAREAKLPKRTKMSLRLPIIWPQFYSGFRVRELLVLEL